MHVSSHIDFQTADHFTFSTTLIYVGVFTPRLIEPPIATYITVMPRIYDHGFIAVGHKVLIVVYKCT